MCCSYFVPPCGLSQSPSQDKAQPHRRFAGPLPQKRTPLARVALTPSKHTMCRMASLSTAMISCLVDHAMARTLIFISFCASEPQQSLKDNLHSQSLAPALIEPSQQPRAPVPRSAHAEAAVTAVEQHTFCPRGTRCSGLRAHVCRFSTSLKLVQRLAQSTLAHTPSTPQWGPLQNVAMKQQHNCGDGDQAHNVSICAICRMWS